MSASRPFRRDPEIDQYLADIHDVPLLTAEQERDLALRMRGVRSRDAEERRRGLEARDRFIQANLRLVVSIARVYLGKGLPMSDLVEEGNVGLLRAVERFDPGKNCRFSTYATWWIRQAIRRALVNTAQAVRLPSYMAEMIAKWRFAENETAQKLGRRPEAAEVDGVEQADAKKVKLKHAVETAARSARLVRLDSTWPAQDLPDRDTIPSAEQAFASRMETEELQSLLRAISPREASILRFRFGLYDGEPLTLGEVGRRLRITRERVRQLERKALGKLHARLVQGKEAS